ncbi:MAG: hypothetical protein ABFS45_13970 [Pseudomonadota bacterium]
MSHTATHNHRFSEEPPCRKETARAISKEMSLTMEQFADTLPKAMSKPFLADYSSSPRFVLLNKTNSVVIKCEQKSARYIGSLTLPVLAVQIEFNRYTPEEAEAFTRQFDRAFLRMGG